MNNAQSRGSYQTLAWGIGILILAAVVGWAGREFEPYEYKMGAGEIALGVLGSLFIVALFVERAQQVYINVWRGMDRRALDRGLTEAQENLQQAEAALADPETPDAEKPDLHSKLPALREAVLEANAKIEDFRTETRKIALIGGMLLGVLIALVGPRLLEAIVTPLGEPQPIQDGLFAALDVLITGGLIGGGSEGIHKLVSLITDFLDETRDRMKTSRQKETTTSESAAT